MPHARRRLPPAQSRRTRQAGKCSCHHHTRPPTVQYNALVKRRFHFRGCRFSRRRLLFAIVAMSLLIHAAGCDSRRANPQPADSTDHRWDLTASDLAEFRPVSAGVTRASSLTLYEGLPHPVWESDQLERELATKQTVQLHNYPFYERTLAVSAADREELRQLSAAAETYFTFRGEKSCGGYHPDYCLTWTDGKYSYDLLVCFGCNEMKLHGPAQDFRLDLRGDAAKRLKAILGGYRDQRPPAR